MKLAEFAGVEMVAPGFIGVMLLSEHDLHTLYDAAAHMITGCPGDEPEWLGAEYRLLFNRITGAETHPKPEPMVRIDRLPRREAPALTVVEGKSTTRTYFIQDGENGPIKIGTSADPLRRLKGFQTSHHNKLTLLATTVEGERALHKRFAHLRLKGEWFRAAPELVTYIAGISG